MPLSYFLKGLQVCRFLAPLETKRFFHTHGKMVCAKLVFTNTCIDIQKIHVTHRWWNVVPSISAKDFEF